ncbi:MAG: hypothetical protein ABW007_19410 [Chitinophagaceae bacterium]
MKKTYTITGFNLIESRNWRTADGKLIHAAHKAFATAKEGNPAVAWENLQITFEASPRFRKRKNRRKRLNKGIKVSDPNVQGSYERRFPVGLMKLAYQVRTAAGNYVANRTKEHFAIFYQLQEQFASRSLVMVSVADIAARR